jgi:hypothetical protein
VSGLIFLVSEVAVMSARRMAWVCALAGVMACDVGELPGAEDLDGVEARALAGNGVMLNGSRFNGFRLNGFRLNGFRLNGDDGSGNYVELESFDLEQGGVVAHAWLDGSELRVELTNGAVLGGAQLVGAVLKFGMVDGAPGQFKNRLLRIAGAKRLAPGSPVWLYDILVKDAPGPWQPLCEAAGGPTEAIMVGAVWDPTTGSRLAPTSGAVTLACRHAALGKCVEWGYHPWEMADYHQACTRLVRADYCGDGQSHTVDGVLIHVLDEIGVQDEEPGWSFVVEAEWGPGGAVCLDAEATRLPAPELACSLPACGEPFASGGLLQTGVLPP